MKKRWLPMIATVEWYAGHRGFERPKGVLVAGVRLEVVVESASAVVPPVAGFPEERVFVVRDGDRRRFRIRVSTEGRTTVEEEVAG